MEGGDDDDKGIVCVTGGTGYVASWVIMKLLQHGYKVHTTIRNYPDLSIVFNTGQFDLRKLNLTDSMIGNSETKLQLETLGLSGIQHCDYGLSWLWRSCKQLKKLQLRSCYAIGDESSLSSFVECLIGLQEVELWTCRAIINECDDQSGKQDAKEQEMEEEFLYSKKDISFLTNLPGASKKLKIFNADLDHPHTFAAAIEGCIGVFHLAHPIDFQGKEPEEVKNLRAINGTLKILNSKTVKRVVYTSSASAVAFNDMGLDPVDESAWSDTEFIRSLNPDGASYYISKTLVERAALEFGEKHGLDLVSVIPSYVNGPFIGPHIPGSVSVSLAMIFGDQNQYKLINKVPMVHIDDVASAYIFLLDCPNAKGSSLKDVGGFKYPDLSSKKLLDTGFKYKYGLEEMYDGAIQCCKEKGFL
ncbi:hypothetical protein TEA_008499 [Camellia sinensis var. sinensis]|uniref:Dihydroflavonol 4-reductase n=1 Tax=Camellia sinensis var. sinensis TaxID=542762 RepID=A0A4S4EWM5_CAMSN|nr:hypothetical protein TEA_008499 [Camellia sinensis var. sinensis]